MSLQQVYNGLLAVGASPITEDAFDGMQQLIQQYKGIASRGLVGSYQIELEWVAEVTR